MHLSFAADGEPKPQGSKRGFVTKTGRVAMVEQAGRPLKDWRTLVTFNAGMAARAATWAKTDEPLAVELRFRMRRPQKPKHPQPATRPDLDKLIRACLDAITDTQAIWADDSQVTILTAMKVYADTPGVDVKVWTSR